MGDVVRTALASSVRQVVDRDPGTRRGDDPEDLHQFRVGIRRLRSDLGTFAPVLDPAWTGSLRDELRWLSGVAGDVRDADVLSARLRGRFSTLGDADEVGGASAAGGPGGPGGGAPADRRSARRLLRRLDGERAAAQSRLLHAMSGDRYDALLVVLTGAAEEPRLSGHHADDDARTVVARLVARRWRRLRGAAAAVGPHATDDDLHAVRIAAKRCRYAGEAASLVWGVRARRFADAVADVQRVLGDHHDTVVAEAWLRRAIAAVPSAGIVAGIVIARERSDREAHRMAFDPAWRAARRPRLRSWLP